jgi:hypothetical protein
MSGGQTYSSNNLFTPNYTPASPSDLMQTFTEGGTTGGTSGGTPDYTGYGNNYLGYLQGIESDRLAAEENALAQQQAELDAAFGRARTGIEQTEQELVSGQPILEEQITQSFDATKPLIERAQGERITGLEGEEEAVVKTGRSELGSQRRLFSELLTAGQKFAGTSVAEGFGELLGRSTAEAIGTIRTNMAQGIRDIQSEMGRVNEFYNQTLLDLESKKQNALRDVRNTFQNELSKIRDAKNLLDTDKANARAGALGDFQNAVAGIRNAAMLQEMEMQKWVQQKNASLSAANNFAVKSWEQFPTYLSQVNAMLKAQNRTLTGPGAAALASHMESGQATLGSGVQLAAQEGNSTFGAGDPQDPLAPVSEDETTFVQGTF